LKRHLKNCCWDSMSISMGNESMWNEQNSINLVPCSISSPIRSC
jgi:hypothetical protein